MDSMTGARDRSAGEEGAVAADAGFDHLRALRPLLEDVVALKRVVQAGRSVSERGFASGWQALATGRDPGDVALRDTRAAVAACVLGPIDRRSLVASGLSRDESRHVVDRAIRERLAALDPALRDRLEAPLLGSKAEREDDAETCAPAFVERLTAAPRAGPTFPGMPRLGIPPTENHAEHCWSVAAMACLVLLAGAHLDRALLGRAYLMGMAHHFHNASLPDGGFTAEMAIGDHLDTVLATGRARGLSMLEGRLATDTAAALADLERVERPEAAAFTVADTLDRVLELVALENVANFSVAAVTASLKPVHPGPLQAFQDRVLTAAGLPT